MKSFRQYLTEAMGAEDEMEEKSLYWVRSQQHEDLKKLIVRRFEYYLMAMNIAVAGKSGHKEMTDDDNGFHKFELVSSSFKNNDGIATMVVKHTFPDGSTKNQNVVLTGKAASSTTSGGGVADGPSLKLLKRSFITPERYQYRCVIVEIDGKKVATLENASERKMLNTFLKGFGLPQVSSVPIVRRY